ncbi:MAG: Na+/H+ antiporter NhaC family protein [Candidatus Cyclonatronum sp.]|uniref:Na+/H+ antiporter NhaC family protein n=1 Tax=Cyclonatronum sp. TaxID=3024185 RepID=UPI0025C1FA4B|nr:Na+/H+ antiporter NhaC family protein [Cyclonatronum sp.]MCH8486821.1 Na+/H+ antiporter NhaC family protein [Cyclonatronum sp.]
MKKFTITFFLSALILAVIGWADLSGLGLNLADTAAAADDEGFGGFGTWVSLLPPLVAIALALITREVVLSLFAGVWIGALFIAGFNPFTGTADSFSFLINAMSDEYHVAIIMFSLMLGGMVGLMSRGGGTKGVVTVLAKLAKNRTQGQLITWISALFLFFDDYANSLIRGSAMRPMTDRLNISREKLAYIVDSTAAPLAVSAVITTWIGFEITQISNSLSTLAAQTDDAVLAAQLQAGADNAFMIFLHSVPYLFYPLLALGFVLMIVLMKRDFGPMLDAERRAYSGGGVIRPGAVPASDVNLESLQPLDGKPLRWYNAAIPVLTVVIVAIYGLYSTGVSGLEPGERSLTNIIGDADPFAALVWASFSGCFVAMLLVVSQKILTVGQALESFVGGMQSMMMAIIILVLAWGLGEVTQAVGTGSYLAGLLQDTLPLVLLPGLVFFIAAVTAFSTGTSWGTMAILFPVVIPLAVVMGAGVGFAGGENYGILLGAISSVMAGAVFGDHCSPISDTTVISSMSSACDLIDHVRTQLPYALVVAAVALVVGEIPAAFGVSPVYGLVVGFALLYLVLRIFGRNPEEGQLAAAIK